MSFPCCHHFFHYLQKIAEELLSTGKNILPWLALILWGLNFEFGVIVLLSACHVCVFFLTRDEAWPLSPDVTAAKTNHSAVCLHVCLRQKGSQEVIAGTFFVVFLGPCPESYQSMCFCPTGRGYHDDRNPDPTGSPPLLPSCIDRIPTYLDAVNTWLEKTNGNRRDLAQVSTP